MPAAWGCGRGCSANAHHTKVHHGSGIHRDPTGSWHTYRPDGTEIQIGREGLLGPADPLHPDDAANRKAFPVPA